MPDVDDAVIPERLANFDCRNNRLAHMALLSDGFVPAVECAIEKYGVHRIGLFLGTSTSGILSSEQAYRQRDPETGALPAWYDFAATHSTSSLADFVGRYLGLEGPAFVVSSACSTTAKVFGNAARMIRRASSMRPWSAASTPCA